MHSRSRGPGPLLVRPGRQERRGVPLYDHHTRSIQHPLNDHHPRRQVDRVASNRHIMGDDGLVAIQRYSSTGSNPEAAAAPEGVIDPSLQVLGLWNGDVAVASLSYYATHPMCGYGQGGVQWDFVGIARQQFEGALPGGPAAVHFTGAAGNIAVGKYVSKPHYFWPIFRCTSSTGSGLAERW